MVSRCRNRMILIVNGLPSKALTLCHTHAVVRHCSSPKEHNHCDWARITIQWTQTYDCDLQRIPQHRNDCDCQQCKTECSLHTYHLDTVIVIANIEWRLILIWRDGRCNDPLRNKLQPKAWCVIALSWSDAASMGNPGLVSSHCLYEQAAQRLRFQNHLKDWMCWWLWHQKGVQRHCSKAMRTGRQHRNWYCINAVSVV